MGNVSRGHALRIAIGITELVLLMVGTATGTIIPNTIVPGEHVFSQVIENFVIDTTTSDAAMMISEAPSAPWWDVSRRFRLPVAVDAGGFERFDKPVEVNLDFSQLLSGLGQTGTLNENSIRVVETDSAGKVLNASVQFQFDKDPDFNGVTKASGTIVFIMDGITQAGSTRYYHIYFDMTGASYPPLLVAPLVTLTDNIVDKGQLSYEIGATGSTYYFQKQAGGFSSLEDSSGYDWISYNDAAGPAGAYRGIPNAVSPEGYFHPGSTCCISNIVTQGPLKIRISSLSRDGKWESTWDIYPGYATMTMGKAGHGYWMLYEGTPGGIFEPDTDFMVRSDGNQTLLSQSWYGDIMNNEWVYFGDPGIGRSLFIAHHEDDTLQDGYLPHDYMTVFGFGKTEQPLAGLISSVPQHFTIGLMDGTEFSQNSKIVYSAYKELTVTKGAAEQYNLPPSSEVTSYTPPTLENLGNTTGNFWVNHTWQAGTGNVTDSYNINVNEKWINGTTSTYYNTSLGPHGWSNITVYAYNNSGNLSLTPAAQNTQIANNIPVQAGIGDKTIVAGTELAFTVAATDLDSDAITYGTNATKGKLNTASGVYSWTPGSGDIGTYIWSFSSSDNYGGIANEKITVEVSNASLLKADTLNITEPEQNVTIRFVDNIVRGEINSTDLKSAVLNVKSQTDSIVSSYNLTLVNTRFAQRVEYAPDQKNTLELIAEDEAGNLNKTSVTVIVGNNTLQDIREINISEPAIITAKNETDTEIILISNVTCTATFSLTAITSATEIGGLNDTASGADEMALGKIVDINAEGLDAANETEIQNVIIKQYYAENELDMDGDGAIEPGELDENKISFYWYDTVSGNWKKLLKGDPQWVLDSGIEKITGNSPGYVWVKVKHLSKFALAAGPVSPSETQNPDDSSSDNSEESSISGGSGGGGGGGASGENYSNIEFKERKELDIYKDRTTSYLFTNQKNPVVFVNITGNMNFMEIITTVEVLKNTSSLVEKPAPDAAYKNMNIWVGVSGFAVPRNIKSAVVGFRVENSWLDKNALTRSNIKLVKWDGSKWSQLETLEKMRDGNYTYFEAKTDSFSHFAITGSSGGEAKTKTTKGKDVQIAVPTEKIAETPAMKATAVTSVPDQVKDISGLGLIMTITAVSMIITGLLAIYMSGRKRR